MNDEELLGRTIQAVNELYEDAAITTHVAGVLKVATGAADILYSHPDCDMQKGWPQDGDPNIWIDENGTPWPLERAGEHVFRLTTFADGRGRHWRWAGGFEDVMNTTQPLLSRGDRTETNVPLCYVLAATGGLRVVAWPGE